MINKYLLPLFTVSIAVLLLHLKGLNGEFYWLYWWYDIPLHILGGVVVTLVYAWLQIAFPIIPKTSWKNILLTVVFFGLAWEAWELLAGDTAFSDRGYVFDTIKDLVNDVIGACLTCLIIKKIS